MKKTILALAALGTFAGAVSAQSSVTLSGGVDLGIARIKDDYKMTPAASGRNNVSLRGTEDLGGGLKAGFFLNHRFFLNNGVVRSTPTSSGANQFWRQGWIQLESASFGDIRLGRMLPTVQEFNGGYEPWAGGDTVGNVHTGGKYAGAADARYSNVIYYRTPSFSGFQGHLFIASTLDQAGGSSPVGERPTGGGVQYKAGPISAAIAFDKNQSDLKTTGVYGKYDFGMAALMFQYEKQDEPAPATKDSKRWSIGATVPVGAFTFKAGYTRWKEEEVRKFGLGLDYALSKRTSLYTDVGKIGGDAPDELTKKTMFDVGIQHKF